MSALFFALVYFFLPNFIDQIVENIEIADEEKKFLRIRSWGFFVAAVFLALNGFFLAIGKTWVIMVSTITFAVSNIIFDYLLVFGVGIFPEMGIEGAALASVIGELFAVMVMLAILFGKQFHISYTLFQAYAVTKSQVNRLLKVGLPLMIQGFLALATWTVFFTWIEHMGRFELTVSHNIRSVYFIAFVPIFGFGATTKTYVSQYLGHHQGDQIKSILRKIQLLSVACLLLLFHGALFYPTQLISLINPDEAFTAESGAILRLVFGSILIYAFISPYFQTINGSGNTRVTLIIEILSILIYLSAAYTFIKILELHIVEVWFVEYIYFGTIGLFSILYLRLFNWKKKVF
jgi:Na+-driven multidrug efflux pump